MASKFERAIGFSCITTQLEDVVNEAEIEYANSPLSETFGDEGRAAVSTFIRDILHIPEANEMPAAPKRRQRR